MTTTREGQPFIVVGADGSDDSVEALRWAIDHARLIGARIVVVTGFDIPVTIWITPTYSDVDYARDAQEMLDRTVTAAIRAETDVPIATHLIQQPPGRALTGAAHGAELLVVGCSSGGAIPGIHLGSVASYCAHHAPCPVLIHRRSVPLEVG
jgi:nucleotide-binding universal stress UspA family protein